MRRQRVWSRRRCSVALLLGLGALASTGCSNESTLQLASDAPPPATKTITNAPEVGSTEGLFELTVEVVGLGSVSPEPGFFAPGTELELSAIPDSGASFVGWFGDAAGSDRATTVTMSRDLNVIASFTADVDFDPPAIGLVAPVWSGENLVLDWRTDEDTTAEVSYGSTPALGATATSTTKGRFHRLTLPGFAIGDEAWFQIEAQDDRGNVGQTEPIRFAVDANPVIDVWYGPTQSFGQAGVPQSWINILGNVRDADTILGLEYRLNGGPWNPVTIGPDGRRLESRGDFNVDIDIESLRAGANEIDLRATDGAAQTTLTTVTANWSPTPPSPLPLSIVWDDVAEITDVAQPVDGSWQLVPGGVRAADVAYDRVLAFGDRTWIDYEARLDVTVTDIDRTSFGSEESVGPSLAFVMGWPGHSFTDSQPQWFWHPSGGTVGYNWLPGGGGELTLSGNNDVPALGDPGYVLRIGEPYTFVMQAESLGGPGVAYRLRVFPAGQPEPDGWNHEILVSDGPPTGSLIFVSHHVDAIFHDMTVTALPDR